VGAKVRWSDVEPELDDVAVLHDVFLTFDAGFGVGAELEQVLDGDGFGGEARARRPSREQRRF
jgi:hypothetical protein